jgi:hypothetical protein
MDSVQRWRLDFLVGARISWSNRLVRAGGSVVSCPVGAGDALSSWSWMFFIVLASWTLMFISEIGALRYGS